MSRWENLANAIIMQAVEDYRNPPVCYGKGGCEPLCSEQEIEEFFNSRWFGALSTADGPEVFKRVKKMVKSEKKQQMMKVRVAA